MKIRHQGGSCYSDECFWWNLLTVQCGGLEFIVVRSWKRFGKVYNEVFILGIRQNGWLPKCILD